MALSLICRIAVSSRFSALRALSVQRRLTGIQFDACRHSISTFGPLSSQSESPPSNPMNSLPKEKKAKQGPLSWKSLVLSAAAVGLLLQLLNMVREKKKKELEKEALKSMGKAAIGGEFELIDHNNKPAASKDFFGKWILLYFGFTHCPDICPEELEKMAKVVDIIDKEKGKEAIQPLFISVDPGRDSPSEIAKYVADFSPRLIGLTGTIDQIKDVCHKFRIYFSMGPKEDDDYIVDHSIIMYLLDPNGEFVDYYSQAKTADDIANNISMHISKHQLNQK